MKSRSFDTYGIIICTYACSYASIVSPFKEHYAIQILFKG